MTTSEAGALPDVEVHAAEILLADADPASRRALVDIAAPLARVCEVTSGAEVLALASRRAFAAIVIDVALPDIDGVNTVRELRRSASGRNVPVLFLVPGDRQLDREGTALGALGVLTRPVDGKAARATLEALVTLYRRGVELERATAEARAKDIYMGVLGHDLRSPLGAISMSARLMLMRDTLGEQDRASVQRIARNAERMAGLIRDILDYTRGQATGGLPIVPRATHMGEICSAMVDEVQLLHGDRAIELETTGDLAGVWDRERVEQVVSNLLTNALKHGKGTVRISAAGLPDNVVVRVHNFGAPIPEHQLSTLFEPFQRGQHSRVGLGLGLYIVREILRSHDGSVEVVSNPERGTLFTTRWPRHRAARPTR
jgi:signal transduction histidine kinase